MAYSIKCFTKVYENAKRMVFSRVSYRVISRMLFSKSKFILIKYFCDVIKLYNRLKIIFSNIFPNIANVDTSL